MQKIFFKKMSGAGNDFIIIDKNQNPGFILTSEKIKILCNRRNGIGADGLITIEDLAGYSYKMIYYNADGSTGSLCGNGARCAIWFGEKTLRLKNGLAKFISNDAEFSGEVLDDELMRAGAQFDICDTVTMDDMEDVPLNEILLSAIED